MLRAMLTMLLPWAFGVFEFRLGGSSRTASDTEYNTETQNLNLQGTEGMAIAGNEGNVDVSVLDAGAIDRAFQFAAESLGTVQHVASAGQQSFEKALSATLATADASQTGGSERLVQLGGLALGAVLILALLMRR